MVKLVLWTSLFSGHGGLHVEGKVAAYPFVSLGFLVLEESTCPNRSGKSVDGYNDNIVKLVGLLCWMEFIQTLLTVLSYAKSVAKSGGLQLHPNSAE